jgi:hypothetical protein
MKEKRLKYPLVEGSVKVTIEGNNYRLLFNERTIDIETTGAEIRAISMNIPPMGKSLRNARLLSSYLSRFGLTVLLRDEAGPVLSMGKGVWTPLGHFSVKYRSRKYLK